MVNYDELIAIANNTIICDSECKKKKTIDTLSSNLDTAKDWLNNGSKKYKEALDAYNLETMGPDAVIKGDISLCYQRLDSFISQNIKDTNENNNIIESLINNYISVYEYYNNIETVKNNFKNKNKNLTNNVDKKNNTRNINNRMSQYYISKLDNNNYYNSILYSLYWIVIIIYSIWFIYTKKYNNKYNIIILVVIISYPTIINFVIDKIYNIL